MAICDCPLKPFCIGESPQLQPSWYGTLWPHLTHALPARLMLSLQAEMYMQSADCIAFLLRIQGVIGIASLSSVWLTMHVVLGGLAAAALAAHDTVVFGLLELRSAHSSTLTMSCRPLRVCTSYCLIDHSQIPRHARHSMESQSDKRGPVQVQHEARGISRL